MHAYSNLLKALQYALIFLSGLLISCGSDSSKNYHGYVEEDAVYLTSSRSGILKERFVNRGQFVDKGSKLFRLDSNPEALVLRLRQAELSQAKEILQDLIKPKRRPEIGSIQAQIEQIDAQLKLAQIRVNRYAKLYKRNATEKDTLDAAIARHEQLEHRKSELKANLALAKLGSREDQIKAQQETVNALTASVENAAWQLSQKTVYAPKSGYILDTFFEEGEFVNDKPVLALLSLEDIRIEFFIPVDKLDDVYLNQIIYFTCMGCKDQYKANISYISPEAEYLPPLVYSRENRDKLVFRVKAKPNKPGRFKPGQPVTITTIETYDSSKRH